MYSPSRQPRYYSATIIRMSGVKDNSTVIWLAAVVASVNFLFTIVGVYLVEKVGRRILTLGSLSGLSNKIMFRPWLVVFR